jgi:tetratricopeptide (TPR) repeat protein
MIAAAVLAAALSAPLQEGLADVAAERYEEAAPKLEAAPDLASSYDGLVGLAVARGRLGRLPEAESPLAQAIRLDPRRPEAHVERGGLRFLQGRYADAAADLVVALRAREEAYTRDLLASALLLSDRALDAVRTWNPAGKPRLASVSVRGLVHTRDAVVRRELRFREGEVLDYDALRASLRALGETVAFADVRIRGGIRQDRDLDLELLLSERHGFGHPLEVASATLTNLLIGRARLRYSNLAGEGIHVSGFYRYEGVRPRLDGAVDWPRPFGLPAQARLVAYRERQPYQLDGPLLFHGRGVDLSFRRVLDGRTVGEIGAHWRRRAFDGATAGAPPDYAVPGTTLVGVLGLERELWSAGPDRVDAAARVQGAGAYAAALGWLRYERASRFRDARPPASVAAARVSGGTGTGHLPIDEMYAPGAAPDTVYPLRGHPLRDEGVLGAVPLGRGLVLVNAEWRVEAWGRPELGVGLTLFQDLARVSRAAIGPDRVLWDAGVGLRLRFGPSSIMRVDYGRSLRDGGHALSVGLGEAF